MTACVTGGVTTVGAGGVAEGGGGGEAFVSVFSMLIGGSGWLLAGGGGVGSTGPAGTAAEAGMMIGLVSLAGAGVGGGGAQWGFVFTGDGAYPIPCRQAGRRQLTDERPFQMHQRKGAAYKATAG